MSLNNLNPAEEAVALDEPKPTHLYNFKEGNQIMSLIDKIPINVKVLREKEMAFQNFLVIVDEYQEQPHLLDPFLFVMFEKLIQLVKENMEKGGDDNIVHEAFVYMYSLSKMRGYKKIIQHLPHEIVDFEAVLSLLARQDPSDVYTWQTRYMLLIWLSIVCMIPFDLHKFDLTNESQENTIMNRMLHICMPYLFSTDKCQDASAYVLAKFMSRPDLKAVVLPDFFEQLFNYMVKNKKSENNIKLLGILKCIASIFKYGKREDILKFTLPTLKHLIQLDLLTNSSLTVIRKFHIKIIQRIGITFFKTKIAKWRYQRGSRVLMEKINKKTEINGSVNEVTTVKEDNDDDNEMIPEEVEDIIDQLLVGLKDQETVVRWSAAKGIGRITNRFSKEMAHDVLSSILDLFTFVEDVFAWHGGCLSIAELGRRGLLLPDQLKIVVPIITNALIFDKKIGNFSFGRNVRDSACYVCWSLARAFEPEILAPHVNQIAATLLIVTVFDREVNCRRGASAAFQENVGRQGQFPHGIDILTKCDYYAVGQLQNCYLKLSKFIANFEEYRKPTIDHLIEHTFNHWDQSIRELTSKALYNLTECCPDYMAFSIIPKLLKHSFSIDLNTRHGALLSLGEIIHALCEEARKSETYMKKFFPEEIITGLKTVINKIFDSKYFRGSGGEYMRPSVCFFIKKLSLSKLFNQENVQLDDNFIKECEVFIRECIEYNKETVQIAASETIPYYFDFKYTNTRKSKLNDANDDAEKFINSFIKSMKGTSKEHVRSGYCSALGNMPYYLFKSNNNFINISNALIVGSKTISGPIRDNAPEVKVENPKNQKELIGWVQARRDAINSLSSLFKLIKTKDDFDLFNLTPELVKEAIQCLLHGLADYSMDAKGDSGSKVREASIKALESFVLLCAEHKINYIINDKELLTQVLGGIMQQAVERIDRTRNIAGNSLTKLIHNEYLKLDHISYAKKLTSVFTEKICSDIDWNSANISFPLFLSLLVVKDLRIYLLTGVIYSIGSLTESLVKPAIHTFLKELKTLKNENKKDFLAIIKIILQLCNTNLKNDRLGTSLIKTVDLIVQNDLLFDEEINEAKIPVEFLSVFMSNVKSTKDMTKLNAYVELFCDMLQFEDKYIRERSMVQLMIMLCHQYPRIRKTTASKLFEALINFTDEIFENDEDNEECTNLLTETNWDQPLDIIRPIRNRICELTKTPQPVKIVKPSPPVV